MTPRTHFWLRMVGLSLIFAAEFGPKLWTASALPARTPVAVVAAAYGR
jgi:hypothetical protein